MSRSIWIRLELLFGKTELLLKHKTEPSEPIALTIWTEPICFKYGGQTKLCPDFEALLHLNEILTWVGVFVLL